MKNVILCLFLFSVSSWGQDVDLTVQTGHSASINTVLFSPDDKFVASSGDDNKIVIWDFYTSKQYEVLLGHENKVSDICFSDDGSTLYSSSLDSTIKIWNIHSGLCEKTIKFDSPVGAISLDESENILFASGRYIRAYSLQKESFIKTYEFKAKNSFDVLDLSDDRKHLFFGGEDEDFAYLVNLETNLLVKKFVAKVRDADIDKEEVFYSTSDGKLAQFNWMTNESKSTTTDWMLNAVNSLAFTDNVLFGSNDKGEVQLYDRTKRWFKLGVLQGEAGAIRSIDLDSKEKFLATTGDNQSIVIWDLESRQVAKVFKGLVHRINDIQFSKDGAEILVGYANGTVRKTNLFSNQTIVNRVKPKSKLEGYFSDYTITNISNFSTENAEFDILYRRKSLIAEGSYDKVVEYKLKWDLRENLIDLEKFDKPSDYIDDYIDDLKRNVHHPAIYFLNKDLLTAVSDSLGLIASVRNDHLSIYNKNEQKPYLSVPLNHSDRVTAIAINEVYGYVATASWDGMIRFWDIKTGDLLTVYGAFGNGQFVYINQEGYYYSSKNALEYIGFKLDKKVYSFEQFDLVYNRPDIVAKSLPYFNKEYISAYHAAYKKRLSKLGLNESDIQISDNLPLLTVEKEFVEGEEIDQVELNVSCIDQNANLDKLHLNINGVPEFGRYGKQLEGDSYEDKFLINLNPGSNYIQLHVTNEQGLSSFKKSFTIVSHKKQENTNLYLISLGVSNYQQTQYNLNFARKDAEDIASFFKKNNAIFDSVNVKTLMDEEVTLENINELKSFVKPAQENDVVILFAAGHGVLDVNLDYYFASNDMNFDDPDKRGIPYELFEEIMDITGSRKKVMFIDACHSGEIDKDEVVENFIAEEESGELIFRGAQRSVKNKYDINSFDLSRSLFADMRLNNGSTVVSSAGGAEFAIEGEQWNNGVFTFALLQGLADKNADLNDDGIIMLSEIQSYIQVQVHNITNGQQTPTSRVENLKNDFRIL